MTHRDRNCASFRRANSLLPYASDDPMSYFTGKKVLITGGSSGIGKALAIQLSREGASVAILARRRSVLDEAIAEIRAAAASDQQRFATVSVDVTDRAALRAAADQALQDLGGLDVLINNSGFAQPLPVDELTDDDIDRMTTINYLGHVNVTRAFIPHFKAQGSGDICNVTSMLGFMGFYGYSAYCGSKYAIVGFTDCLRQEMMLHGVRTTLFYPPTTDTPGLQKENEVKPAATWAIEGKGKAFTSEQVAAAILKGIAKGRYTNMIGAENWAIYYINRWFPGLVRWILDGDLKKFQAQAK